MEKIKSIKPNKYKLPLKIIIHDVCRPKKNSQQIWYNPRTRKPFIQQSKRYLTFERFCAFELRDYYGLDIAEPVNLKVTFFVPDRRKRDIVNLLNAIQDILVKYHVLADDNYQIIKSTNGTQIVYEKGRSETVIEIEKV